LSAKLVPPAGSDWFTGTTDFAAPDQERKHLKRADRHLAEVNKLIARQREIIEAAIDKGRPSIEAQLLLQALETSRRTFEKHRHLILDLLANAGRLPPRNDQ
jgi:hypothetical protein